MMNKKSNLYHTRQCCYGALMLAIVVSVSIVFEVHHVFLGVAFRLFDKLLLLMILPILGLSVGLILAFLVPLVHWIFDNDHPVVDVFAWIIVNCLFILIIYFGYYYKKMLRTEKGNCIFNHNHYFREHWDESLYLLGMFMLFAIIEMLSFFSVVLTFSHNYLSEWHDTYDDLVSHWHKAWGLTILLAFVPFMVKYFCSFLLFVATAPKLTRAIYR